MRRWVPSISDVFGDLPSVETERLLLRKVTLEDATDMFEYARQPEMSLYTTWEPHTSVEDSRARLYRMVEMYAEGAVSEWGIEYKENGKFIGTCGFISWRPDSGRAEIGYGLNPAYWGRGLMTEAGTAILDFGFTRMALNRIEAQCMPDNTGSSRVTEKIGMKYEGLLRERLYAKGRYYDLKIYAILRRDWSAAQSCMNF